MTVGVGALGELALGELSLGTTVSLDWLVALSEPVRARPGVPAAAQQAFFAGQPPIVSFGWFAPLSEPARARPKIAAQVPFAVQDTAAIPVSRINWFMPLSEPVRKRPGLEPLRQQFLAAPSRLLPTPTVFGTMQATETGDAFQGGGRVWNRVVSGEVGALEHAFSGAQVAAVVAAPSAGTSGVVAPVTAPASGSPVPTVAGAKVGITIR